MALENWARSWSCGAGATSADVAAHYHEDAIRREVNTGTIWEGPKGVTEFADLMFGAAPDAVCKIRTQVERGSTVAVEWTWTGTHTGDLEGWTATGKEFVLEGCTVIELDDGLIRDERAYWDWESLRAQA
jgi:steroid delta-isomerase-like uncharacterized protein